MIREHPYIQYFLGYADYRYDISLDPSLLTHFRKRFPADVVAQVNRWVVDAARAQASDEENDNEEGGDGGSVPDEPAVDSAHESENHGTLIIDASCAPQDIPVSYTHLYVIPRFKNAIIQLFNFIIDRNIHSADRGKENCIRIQKDLVDVGSNGQFAGIRSGGENTQS